MAPNSQRRTNNDSRSTSLESGAHCSLFIEITYSNKRIFVSKVTEKIHYSRLPSGLGCGSNIAESLVILMAILLILLDPWHSLLSSAIGVQTYLLMVLLLTLLLIVNGLQGRLGDYSALGERPLSIFASVAVCLMICMLVRFDSIVGAKQIFGSVIVPFGLGAFLALLTSRNNLGLYLGAAQLIKVALLILLSDAYFQAFPKRPMLFDEAMYLLFGVGLDASVGMLIILVSSMRGWLKIAAGLFLPLLAFTLVGLNSRGLLVSGLFIGLLAVCFAKANRKAALWAFLGFTLSVVGFSLLLPGRTEHWGALLGTILSQIGLGNKPANINESTMIRLGSITWLTENRDISAFGTLPAAGDAYILTFHFFPLVLYYVCGLVGLILFTVLWAGVVHKAMSLIRCHDPILKVTGFFGLGAALQVGYWGLLFNSQVQFMLFGFFLAFPGIRNNNPISVSPSKIA